MMKAKCFVCRPVAIVLAVLLLLFAPLGSYMDSRMGKVHSQAFAVAIPIGIAAYDLILYALITAATAAGVYGLATTDWDDVVWEFKRSLWKGDAIQSVDSWAESLISAGDVYYDDGSMRNILIDYAMADMVNNFTYTVGVLEPDFDLSDLPQLDLGDYDTIDWTAVVLEGYYERLRDMDEPVLKDKEDQDDMTVELESFIEQLINQLEEAGAHVPEKPESVSAQNELNQAICDYLNYIVHAFDANSTFYNPQNNSGFNVHISEYFLTAWLAFLVSKGLVSSVSDSSATSGLPVSYEYYDAYSMYGVKNCIDISDFLYPGGSVGRFYYGIPVGLEGQRGGVVYSPQDSLLKRLNFSYSTWFASFGAYGTGSFNAFDSSIVFTWGGSSWTSNSLRNYRFSTAYNDDGTVNLDGDGKAVYIGSGWYSPASFKILSSSDAYFAGNIKFIKDGVIYSLSDFLDQKQGDAYMNPTKSPDDLPLQPDGSLAIYPSLELPVSLPGFFDKVDAVAQSPSVDLTDPLVRELFDTVNGSLAPPTTVVPEPDIPVNPDSPIVPGVPVTPVNPGGSDTIGDPDLDGMQLPSSITDKFPFCVPFDLIKCVKVWDVPSKAPVWEFPFVVESLGINYTLTIDLTIFDSVISTLRLLVLLSYIVFLIVVTRQLIKG